MDNYATHKKAEIRDWLEANPRIHFHFTPTSESWLNLVEVWFSIIERQAIHRGSFGSVKDLDTNIRAFIEQVLLQNCLVYCRGLRKLAVDPVVDGKASA